MSLSRLAAWLSVASLALVALGAPLFELAHGKFPGAGWSGRFGMWSLRSGGVARELETRLEKDAELTARLRPHYNEALFLSLGMVTSRVVLGRDDWLFLASESRHWPPANGMKFLDFTCGRVGELVRWFESNGTTVVLLVVPRKATVHPEMLPEGLRERFQPVYPQLLEALRTAGVDAPDLLAPLQASDERVFRPNDDHWDHPGARIAAEVICARIRERLQGRELPGAPLDAELVTAAPIRSADNLVRMLGFRPNGALVERFTIERTPIVAQDRRTRVRLHGSEKPEAIALVGTSFSGAGHLASLMIGMLGRPVENRAREGHAGGYRITELAREILLGERPAPQVLVWEFPEDFLVSHVRTLTEPVHALVDLVESDAPPMRAEPLPVARARAEGVLLSAEGERGWEGTAPSGDAQLVLELEQPLPGDGTVWIHYTAQFTSNVTHTLSFEGADGQLAPFPAERPMLASIYPNPIVARVRGAGGQPVTRLRLTVADTYATFKLSRPSLWRSAAAVEGGK